MLIGEKLLLVSIYKPACPLKSGANPDIQDHYGNTALINAAFNGRTSTVQLLLDMKNSETNESD